MRTQVQHIVYSHQQEICWIKTRPVVSWEAYNSWRVIYKTSNYRNEVRGFFFLGLLVLWSIGCKFV